MVDPLTDLEIDVQSFDIPRLVTVYPDKAGMRWWTKAWFNNREEGEASVEISRQVAVKFIQDLIDKDTMLEEYFPKQMEVYHHAIEQTKEQLLPQMNLTCANPDRPSILQKSNIACKTTSTASWLP